MSDDIKSMRESLQSIDHRILELKKRISTIQRDMDNIRANTVLLGTVTHPFDNPVSFLAFKNYDQQYNELHNNRNQLIEEHDRLVDQYNAVRMKINEIKSKRLSNKQNIDPEVSKPLVDTIPDVTLSSNTVLMKMSEQLSTNFSSEYMTAQIKQMLESIEANPADAIGKAKEILESVCATILGSSEEFVGISFVNRI